MDLNEIIRETCSCGEVEHNPNTCPACQEVGSWAETYSSEHWFEAHVNHQIQYHIRDGKVFAGEHNE